MDLWGNRAGTVLGVNLELCFGLVVCSSKDCRVIPSSWGGGKRESTFVFYIFYIDNGRGLIYKSLIFH